MNFQLSFQSRNFRRHANSRKKCVRFQVKTRNARSATTFPFERVSVSRVTLAASVCRHNSLKFKTQLSIREARQLFRATTSEEIIFQFQRILSGASDLSLPTRNAELLINSIAIANTSNSACYQRHFYNLT